MSNAIGIDISSHNGPINWQVARASGLDFAFIKATEGTGYRWNGFVEAWAAAKSVGVLRGAYHFMRWDVDPTAQSAYFLGTVPAEDRGELPLTVDVEGPGDGAGRMVRWDADGERWVEYDTVEALRRLRVFVDNVTLVTGKKPILYTYPSMWHDTLGNPTTFTDCPLWIANYRVRQPTIPGGWAKWTFWQWTDSGSLPGVSGIVDKDVYNGSADELRQWAGVGESVYVPQTGHNISHGFLAYWREHQGLGYPLTEEFPQTLEDGNEYTVQLFERGLLQWKAGQAVQEARIGFMWGKLKGIL